MTEKLRVLFYVQHLLGIGHLARASRLADALSDGGFDVTVVTGGAPVPGFPSPRVRHVTLPEVRAAEGFADLVDAAGAPIDDAFKARRRDRLRAVFDEVKPDVVVIEAFPFGRRQVRFELIPLLERIHAMTPRPRVVASVRDILQERAKPGRDRESADLARKYFDRVLVHGDPAFVRIGDTFPLAVEIADLVVYTGLVAAPLPPAAAESFDVVVSAGGGAVGGALLRAASGAAALLPKGLTWALIAGGNLPESDYRDLADHLPGNARLFRFRKDFVGLLRNARLSVSQAGYNTVCDLLGARCRMVLVPFAAGGETEQTLRAEKLQALGLAQMVTEAELSAETLAAAARAALAAPLPDAIRIDLEGTTATVAAIRSMF